MYSRTSHYYRASLPGSRPAVITPLRYVGTGDGRDSCTAGLHEFEVIGTGERICFLRDYDATISVLDATGLAKLAVTQLEVQNKTTDTRLADETWSSWLAPPRAGIRWVDVSEASVLKERKDEPVDGLRYHIPVDRRLEVWCREHPAMRGCQLDFRIDNSAMGVICELHELIHLDVRAGNSADWGMLRQLQLLEHLAIRDAELSADFAKALGSLSSLRLLSLHSCRVDGYVWPAIGHLPGVKMLIVSACSDMDDDAVANMCQRAMAVTHVDMSGTTVGDRALVELARWCPALRRLDVSGTVVTDDGADYLLLNSGIREFVIRNACVSLEWVLRHHCGPDACTILP